MTTNKFWFCLKEEEDASIELESRYLLVLELWMLLISEVLILLRLGQFGCWWNCPFWTSVPFASLSLSLGFFNLCWYSTVSFGNHATTFEANWLLKSKWEALASPPSNQYLKIILFAFLSHMSILEFLLDCRKWGCKDS